MKPPAPVTATSGPAVTRRLAWSRDLTATCGRWRQGASPRAAQACPWRLWVATRREDAPRPARRVSYPFPAVLRVEAHAARNKEQDVPHPLERYAAAVVHDVDARHERVLRHLRQPHAPVEILDVEKETRMETAGALDGGAPREQERGGEHRHADRLARRLAVDDVAHLVARKPAREHSLQESRREAAQHQVGDGRIALAEILPTARRVGE